MSSSRPAFERKRPLPGFLSPLCSQGLRGQDACRSPRLGIGERGRVGSGNEQSPPPRDLVVSAIALSLTLGPGTRPESQTAVISRSDLQARVVFEHQKSASASSIGSVLRCVNGLVPTTNPRHDVIVGTGLAAVPEDRNGRRHGRPIPGCTQLGPRFRELACSRMGDNGWNWPLLPLRLRRASGEKVCVTGLATGNKRPPSMGCRGCRGRCAGRGAKS